VLKILICFYIDQLRHTYKKISIIIKNDYLVIGKRDHLWSGYWDRVFKTTRKRARGGERGG
jgi:hypothetical protein